VGLRCKNCASPGRSPLYSLAPHEYVIAGGVSLVTSLIAGTVMTQIGLLFAFFLSAPAGGFIAEAVSRSLHGRRGRALQIITGAGILVGALLGPWLWAALSRGNLALIPTNPLNWLASLLRVNTLVYAFLAVGAAIARLR
jgi:MFS family permease